MSAAGISLTMALWLVMSAPPNPEKFYIEGEKLFTQKKYAQASANFKKAYDALEQIKKGKKAGSQAWNLLEFGQAETIYRRAKLASLQGQKLLSCRLFKVAMDKLKGLPKTWPNWSVKQEARDRMKQAQNDFPKQCDKQPSMLKATLTPPTATVERFDEKTKKWVPFAAQSKAKGVALLPILIDPQKELQLRISAPGYFSKTQKVKVGRWEQIELSIQLVKDTRCKKDADCSGKPGTVCQKSTGKCIKDTRCKSDADCSGKTPQCQRSTGKCIPKAKKKGGVPGWLIGVLIGGGVVLAGGAVATIIALNQPYVEGLRDSPDSPGFTIFKPAGN